MNSGGKARATGVNAAAPNESHTEGATTIVDDLPDRLKQSPVSTDRKPSKGTVFPATLQPRFGELGQRSGFPARGKETARAGSS
jgi:hypothetical protein